MYIVCWVLLVGRGERAGLIDDCCWVVCSRISKKRCRLRRSVGRSVGRCKKLTLRKRQRVLV